MDLSRAGTGYIAPRGRPGHGAYPVVVPVILVLFLTVYGSPEAQDGVVAAGGQGCAIWRPAQGFDGSCVCAIGEERFPRFCLPDMDCAVLTCRGKILAVRRPVQGVNRASVAVIGSDRFACLNIPDLDASAKATRCDLPSIRGPGHGEDAVELRPGGEILTAGCLPDVDSVVAVISSRS